MFNTDQSVSHTKDDILDRKNFIEKLSKAILKFEHSDSFVIGLYGGWGTGKTSIINMLLSELEPNKDAGKLIIVKFNPWYFSGQDQILKQFLKILKLNIQSKAQSITGSAKAKLEGIGKNLENLASLMEPLKYAKYIFPILGISEEIKPAIEDMAKALKISSDNDIFDPISQKEKISQTLKDIEYKILIVIDDIDRLNKDEICQIFQLVKSVADFPNTIYILSFSPDVVTTSLAGIQGIEGRKYGSTELVLQKTKNQWQD
jgi:predicted KAP-like P-loop ATPase